MSSKQPTPFKLPPGERPVIRILEPDTPEPTYDPAPPNAAPCGGDGCPVCALVGPPGLIRFWVLDQNTDKTILMDITRERAIESGIIDQEGRLLGRLTIPKRKEGDGE